MRMNCASCGVLVQVLDKVGFRDTCPSCDAYLHSCVNCTFLVDGLCTEPAAEKVRDQEGINFCDWFKASTQHAAPSTQEGKEADGKEAAEELWKKLTKK